MTADGRIVGVGFNAASFSNVQGLQGLDALLGRIAASGATHAEISLFAFDLIANGRILPWQRDRFREISRRHDLTYTAHGPLVLNLMDAEHHDIHKRVLRANLELCDVVGAKVLVHHPGFPTTDSPDALEEGLRRERDALAEMADIAQRYGVRIAVETLFPHAGRPFALDPSALAGELAAINHPNLGATLDFGHVYIHSTVKGFGFFDAIAAIGPWVRHLHVHDQFGRPEDVACITEPEKTAYGMGDLHLPPGWGDLPWAEIMQRLPLRAEVAMIMEISARFHAEMESCVWMGESLATICNGSRVAA